MTYNLKSTTNLKTMTRRVFVNGQRVSEARFNEFRAIGCFLTNASTSVRRFYSVGVLKNSASPVVDKP